MQHFTFQRQAGRVQRFAFQRQAVRLRANVRMWQVGSTVDAGIVLIASPFLPRPANLMAFGFGLVYLAFLLWWFSRPLRRRHVLTENTLVLVDRSGKAFPIPRDRIQSAARYTAVLPRRVAIDSYTYVPELDTLFILPDKQSLVEVTLKQPVSAQLAHRVVVEFTRVVCLVDEPEAFIAAVLPDRGADEGTGDEALPVSGDAPTGGRGPGLRLPVMAPNDPAHEGQVANGGQAAIELSGLTRRFGDFTAVDRLSLRVAPGEIFAFVGSNGAGKSTTIKMMVGLLRPTGGRVLIRGGDPWRDLSVRRLVGYVPDTPMLYENLTAREHLWLVGGLYDLTERAARSRAAELLQQMGLERHGDQPVRSFSLGMKRKLAIASALMHHPPILLLDEATNGLDPRAAREVKDFIRAAARGGTTIFLTTHLLDVVSELAERIAIIDQGVLLACGTMAQLQAAFGSQGGTLEEVFLLATDRSGQEAVGG